MPNFSFSLAHFELPRFQQGVLASGRRVLSLVQLRAALTAWRFLVAIGLLSLIVLMASSQVVSAAEQSEEWPLPSHLKFKPGDSPEYSETSFDDADWLSVPVSDATRAGASLDPAGRGWFRLHFSAPQGAKLENIAVYLGLIGCADEVYLNGQLVGKTGSLKSSWNASFRRVRAYDLSAAYLRADQDNILAIRGINFISQRMLEGPLMIGAAHEVYEKARSAHARWWLSDVLLATIGSLAFIGWLLLRSSRWSFAGSLWVGVTFASIAVSTCCDLFVIDSEQPPIWAWGVSKLAFQLYMIVYLLAVRALVDGKPRWLVCLISLSGALNAVLGFFAPYEWQELFITISVVIGSLGIPLNVYWIVLEGRRQVEMSRRLALAGGLGFALLMVWHFVCMRTSWIPSTEIHVWVTESVIALTALGLLVAACRRVLMARDQQLNLKASYAAAGIGERRRLAQELHDGVVQDLCAARLTLETASMLPDSEQAGLIEDVLGALKSASESLRAEARGIFAESGESWPSFESRMNSQAVSHGFRFYCDGLDCLQKSLSGPVSHQVQQICAEAVTNSIQHSKGQEIALKARRVGATIELCISDDGQSISSGEALSLRQRVFGSLRDGGSLPRAKSEVLKLEASQSRLVPIVDGSSAADSKAGALLKAAEGGRDYAGIGLSTMRERAAQIEAYFNVEFSPQGALVELHVDLGSEPVQSSVRAYEQTFTVPED